MFNHFKENHLFLIFYDTKTDEASFNPEYFYIYLLKT